MPHRLHLPVKLLLQRLDPPLQSDDLSFEKLQTSLHFVSLHSLVPDKPFDSPNALQDRVVLLLQSLLPSVDVLQVAKHLAEALVRRVEALAHGHEPSIHTGKAFVYRVELPPQERD